MYIRHEADENNYFIVSKRKKKKNKTDVNKDFTIKVDQLYYY